MQRIVKVLFFAIIVKPLVLIILGLNVRGRGNLPQKGPAIVIANHNSHLDALVLMSLYPLSMIHRIRPVAAADYFYRNAYLKWFVENCIGIIPLNRNTRMTKDELFAASHQALDQGDILIIFPEGSRGEPERLSSIKKGVFYIVEQRQDTQITPVVMRGLGKSLPKGEALFVPFNCDVVVGETLEKSANAEAFITDVQQKFVQLLESCTTHH